MKPTEDQIRAILYYEYKLNSTAAETFKKINEVFPGIIGRSTCYKWFTRFEEGRVDMKNEQRSGRPSTLDNEQLKDIIEENPRQTTQQLGDILGKSKSTINRHLHSLGKINKYGSAIPHELSDENMNLRARIATSLLLQYRKDPFLSKVVTMDEKWVLYSNRKLEKQWLYPGDSGDPTVNPNTHEKKVLLSVWWDYKGIIYYEVLSTNQTINAEIFCQQLDRFHSALKEKRYSLVNRKGVILHLDNARPHVAIKSQKKFKS